MKLDAKAVSNLVDRTIKSLPLSEQLALCRWFSGEKPSFSTSIAGNLSIGYERLDLNGFWEFPLPQNIVILYERDIKSLNTISKIHEIASKGLRS